MACPSTIITSENFGADESYTENGIEIDRNKLLECQGICGKDHYIHVDYSGGEPSAPECRPCVDDESNPDYEPTTAGQCNSYDAQFSVNIGSQSGPQDDYSGHDWSSVNNVSASDCVSLSEDDPNREGCEILSYYQNTDFPMTDQELINMFGYIDRENQDGSFSKILGPQYSGSTQEEKLVDLKNKIHTSRGGTVICNPDITSIVDEWTTIANTPAEGDSLNDPGGCVNVDRIADPVLSNNHIIQEEAYEYAVSGIHGQRDEQLTGFNFQQLFSGAASSSEFEACMNTLLGDDTGESYCEGKNNHEVQEEIASVNNVLELRPCHINYIEDKLKRISVLEVSDAQECMAILNLSESICEQDVSTKMLEIAYLIFHVIGLDNIDLQSISPGSPEYHQLTRLVDRLTPYIKMAIKKIIDISKHYEENTCGRESTTTHVLERMYIDIFEKSKEVSINFNALDLIPTYLTRDTNIEEFVKTVILMVIAIAAVYVLLMVLNRPPVPVAK